jgi:predicted nucleotidyltransferase component of viral defense system
MITENELRRIAAQWRVDPMVVDLDYSLGWFVAGLYSNPIANTKLRFKGGTCLRKCYFADYRFSEDLDFTATGVLTPEVLEIYIDQARGWVTERDGPDYNAASPRIDVVEDEYGSESFQARIYYRGPLRWGGSPRAIRLDITRHETLCLPAVAKVLIHPYGDQDRAISNQIPCYDLSEVLAEKLRAVGGQRQFAISRDLYDIHRLVASGVSVESAINIIPEKFKAREVDIAGLTVDNILSRRHEFQVDWDRRLAYLISMEQETAFDQAFETVINVVRLVQQHIETENNN